VTHSIADASPEVKKPLKLTLAEEFVLFVLARSPGLTAYEIGQRWCTSSDDRSASSKVKVLRDLGLVHTDKGRRPWEHRLTEAGLAEVARRKKASR